MTAHTMEKDEARCLSAGMDGYLSKPLERHRFIDVVERHLRTSRDAFSPIASPAWIEPLEAAPSD